MATELKEATVKVVLSTKDAVAQAEGFAKEEAEARSRGTEAGKGGGAAGSSNRGATSPGRGAGGGDRGDGGRLPIGPGAWWDAGKAAWNGSLTSHVASMRGNLPVLGPIHQGADFAAEYGAPGARALERFLGPANPLTATITSLEKGLAEVRSWRDQTRAKLEALDGAIDQTKAAVLTQAKLWHGEVDPVVTQQFALRAYRVQEALATGRAHRKLAEQMAAAEALGFLGDRLFDALSDSTRLSAGR